MTTINSVGAPSGLTDPDVTVARVETADRRVGLLLNYAAHPITMTKNPPVISADYPGAASRYLELDGAAVHAQFLQGTCGNLNMKIHGDAAERDLMGKALANAALDAVRTSQPSDSAILRVAAETVRIPWQKIPTLDEARACLEKERAAMAARPGSFASPLDWAEDLVRTLEAGPAPPHIEVLVQAARIGHAAFLTLPGEVFFEIGLAIKQRAGVEHLFVVAYANHCEIGYVPTAAAFAEGGYEVDNAPRYYGLFTLSPQCESIMVEAGVKAVGQVMRET
ncbi:MAG: hypothetical protein FJ272_11050 [Planctomycetes bacterium]|nr:hypothetical protein [Planctomycetota bacterium]